jgi:two-component system sensor histidine kinase HydH
MTTRAEPAGPAGRGAARGRVENLPGLPSQAPSRRWALSGRAWVFLWLPVVAITIAHFGTPGQHEWLHDVFRRLYYIPIIVGAFLFGLRGALLTSFMVTVLYLPHAFWLVGPHAHHRGMLHADPTGTANKVLELLLYNVVALVAGLLVERERRARRDVEQKMVEMQAMERQLVRAGRLHALGELTAGLAHEIKNPLASLKTASAIVADEIPETSPRRKMVDILQTEIDRLAALLERFLAFARPGQMTFARVEVAPLVEQAMTIVRPQAEVRRVVLRLRETVAGLAVEGDAVQLTQVLLNVLLNAVQFSPEGGKVDVRCRRCALPHGRFAEISIADEGPGIPTADAERIFDPFFSTRENGTGLGLAIASRLMDEHRGHIEVESRPGRGTELRLRLPLRTP